MKERRQPPEGFGPDGLFPNLARRTVSGVFDRREDAEAAVTALLKDGWPPEDLRLRQVTLATLSAFDAAARRRGWGLVVGAVVGAALGALIGLATDLAVTRLYAAGPNAAVGPTAIALVVVLAAGAMGALFGSSVGLSVRSYPAVRHAETVWPGGSIVAVATPNSRSADHACRLLHQHGARSLNVFNAVL